MDKLEKIHNQLSDLKIVWFPYLFLKPEPHELILWPRILKMAPCFSLYFVLGAAVRDILLGNGFELGLIPIYFIYGVFGFLVWFNVVTAPLWNRRARRLFSSR